MGVNHSHLYHIPSSALYSSLFFSLLTSPVRRVRRDVLCCLRSVRTAPLLCFPFLFVSVCVLCAVSAFCRTWLIFLLWRFVRLSSICLKSPESSASSPGRGIRSFAARQRTLKKLTRKKKKKKEKKKEKKVHDLNFAFSRNCQTCIHFDPRMQRAQALTLSPPHSFKLNDTELLLWPTHETDGFSHEIVYIYVARQRLSFSNTEERGEKKRRTRSSTIPSALSSLAACGGRGTLVRMNCVKSCRLTRFDLT